MKSNDFVDYYEILEVSPNANTETIERVFRYLAHRFHPDTSDTKDKEKFNRLVEACEVLKDPARRAAYDAEHRKYQEGKSGLKTEAASSLRDVSERHQMLSVFYAKRSAT